jgi:hypothetical protein
MLVIESKKKKGLCCAYRCSNKAAPRDKFCHKHRKRYQKENNTLTYVYGFLKNNAKRRGKSFELTKEEFKQFCEETGYLELRGKKAKSASIDRIDPRKGYSIDNIQILTLAENSSKSDNYENPF